MADDFAEGTIIKNPQTGQRAQRRGGKWVLLGSSEAMRGLPAADEKALTDMTANAQQRAHLAERSRQFMEAQRAGGGTATGPVYGPIEVPFLGNVNPMEGLSKIINPKLQVMDSINNQTWPELRPTGSGPMRNTEVAGFKTAFPSTANYGTSNAEIDTRLQREAREANLQTTFVNEFVRQGKGTVADANTAFSAWKASPGYPLNQAAPTRAAGNDALRRRSAANPSNLTDADLRAALGGQ